MSFSSLFYKIKSNKTLVNGGLFSIYSFIGRGIAFLLLILLANYIPPSEYGSLSLFNTVVSFVTIFIALSTEGYFSISFFKKSGDDFKKDFGSIYILGIITLFFFIIIILIGGEFISHALELSRVLLFYAVIISFFTFSFHIQQNYYRVQEKVVSYGYYNVGNALSNFILSLFLVIALGQSWMGRVHAQLICSLLFGVLSIYFFLKKDLFKFDFSKSRYKEIITWGLPMIPHHATGWIRQGLDRYIINFYYSIFQVGIFSYALNVTNIIEMIGSAFNSTNSVTLFQTLSSKELNNQQKMVALKKQIRMIGLIYLLASICVILIMTVITFFALPKYREAIPFFWILSFSGFLKCLYFLYCNFFFYYNLTKQLMYITFGTSMVHLLLSLSLTRFSLFYTAAIYVIVQLLMDVFVYKKSMTILKKNLSY